MTTYKEIKGQTVETLTADPPAALAQGEMWYRSDSDLYKFGASVQSWASGGTLPKPRTNMGSGGVTDAMWMAGGSGPPVVPGGPNVDQSFWYYNGASWSVNTPVPGNRVYCQEGVGIQDAFFLGHGLRATPPTGAESAVLEYSGSWSSAPCGNNRRYGAGFGTTAAAMVAGGSTWPNVWNTNSSNTWNGTSWTQEGTLPVGRNLDNASTGIETAGFILGGNPGSLDLTSEWNGTAWSNDGAYPSVVQGSACGGPISAAISVGGYAPSVTDQAMQYNGSTWSSYGATLPIACANMGSAPNSQAGALTSFAVYGGNAPPGAWDETLELSESAGIKQVTTT